MKTLYSNVMEPSTTKIASITGNKLTRIGKSLYNGKMQMTCRLNGNLMTVRDARKEMLQNVEILFIGTSQPVVL